MQNTHKLTASLRFLERSSLYEKEKPYTIDYRIPTWEADIERTNFRADPHEVVITDIRGKEDQFTFDANGFAVIETESEMSYEDFQDRKKIETVFCEEIASSLLQYFNDAAAIRVFDVEVSADKIAAIGLSLCSSLFAGSSKTSTFPRYPNSSWSATATSTDCTHRYVEGSLRSNDIDCAAYPRLDGTNRACLELLKELEDASKFKRHIFIK